MKLINGEGRTFRSAFCVRKSRKEGFFRIRGRFDFSP